MKSVKVGVVGVGYLGKFHAEKYAAMPDVELVGLIDPDAGRAAEVAGRMNTRAFTDPSYLIGKVDAVSIVVPTVLHHQVAKRFLEQGVHILLEKPITVTLEQADELIDLAYRKGLILQTGHIERFNPALTAIRPMLKSPRYLVAERAAPFTIRCTDVNVVLDLMIHDLDIVMGLAGSLPKEVSAAGASVVTNEIDTATARIAFINGCVADVTASRVSDEKKRVLRVFDGENMFLSDFQAQKAVVSRRGIDPIPSLVANDIASERRDTLADEIQAFVQSVRSGAQPLVSGVEGRRALALAQVITNNIQNNLTGFVPVS